MGQAVNSEDPWKGQCTRGQLEGPGTTRAHNEMLEQDTQALFSRAGAGARTAPAGSRRGRGWTQ